MTPLLFITPLGEQHIPALFTLRLGCHAGWSAITTEASAFSYELFLPHGFTLSTGVESVERARVSFTRHRLHCFLPS